MCTWLAEDGRTSTEDGRTLPVFSSLTVEITVISTSLTETPATDATQARKAVCLSELNSRVRSGGTESDTTILTKL